jgi:transcriptional regulator with XRE-family HTH domain
MLRIEDVIGQQVARGREDLGMTQAELGDELSKYLGKPWPRQAVSAAEKGRRSFGAAELVALAAVLGRPVESLLVPPSDVASVTLAEGDPIDSRHLRGFNAITSDDSLRQLIQTVVEMGRGFPRLLELATRLDDLRDKVALELWAVARGRGVEVDNNLLGLPARKAEQ